MHPFNFSQNREREAVMVGRRQGRKVLRRGMFLLDYGDKTILSVKDVQIVQPSVCIAVSSWGSAKLWLRETSYIYNFLVYCQLNLFRIVFKYKCVWGKIWYIISKHCLNVKSSLYHRCLRLTKIKVIMSLRWCHQLSCCLFDCEFFYQTESISLIRSKEWVRMAQI